MKSVISLLAFIAINPAFSATLVPDGHCVSKNCVRYVLNTDDNLQIRVSEWEKSDGTLNTSAPAVVFINGFPHSQLEWLPVVQSELSNKFRLITFDLRGQGLSDKPTTFDGYAPGKYGSDIQDIIGLLGLSNVVLVSHSHGGTALVDYIASQGVSALKGIVLMSSFTKVNLADAGVTTDIFTHDTIQLAPRLLSDEDEADYLAAGKKFVELSSNAVLPKVGVDFLAMDMMSPAKARQAIFFPPRNVSNLPLSNLAIPSLVIHGSKDRLINLSHAIENEKLLGAKSHIVIYEGIGHLPQFEATSRLVSDLDNFLLTVTQ